jgi:hypothetical protein
VGIGKKNRTHGGIVLSLPADVNREERRQVDTNRDRFLEIPRFDYSNERSILAGFAGSIRDTDLKNLLSNALAGRKPYGNINDILSFFPEEQERLLEMKDEFVTSRVKSWLEEHNLFTVETESMLSSRT